MSSQEKFLPVRVALVHDWLTGMRGGEKCLEVFCELFPDAPIFTLFHLKGSVSQAIERHKIVTSFLNAIPFSQNTYRYYLPLFPFAIRSFDLRGYDLIFSSSHCVAKGIRVPDGVCHLSYVHTPMRYIWDAHEQYFVRKTRFSVQGMGMAIFRKWLQRWDMESNDHVHGFIANSLNVAKRINRHYGEESSIVYPPVDWHSFKASDSDEGFYLMVTAFAPYKRVDLAIQAANRLKISLKIIGKGQDDKSLRRLAGPTVEFLGWQSDECIRDFYRRCRAVLFPGEEDFGIVPLEAMASGKPVIAYGKGGARETVIPLNPSDSIDDAGYPTGVFFYQQTVEALSEVIQLFEQRRNEFDPLLIRAHVDSFDRANFKERIRQVIMTNMTQFEQFHSC